MSSEGWGTFVGFFLHGVAHRLALAPHRLDESPVKRDRVVGHAGRDGPLEFLRPDRNGRDEEQKGEYEIQDAVGGSTIRYQGYLFKRVLDGADGTISG